MVKQGWNRAEQQKPYSGATNARFCNYRNEYPLRYQQPDFAVIAISQHNNERIDVRIGWL